jgi:cytochrome P450
MSHKYNLPGLYYLDLWPVAPSIVVVTDPDVAMHLTVTRNHEKHVEELKAMDPLIGKGNIATSEGARWKKMHKMLAPAFAITHVTNLRPMVAKNVMEFRSILNKLAQTGETFELEKYIERLALDIIGTATFGHSLGAQTAGSLVMRHWEDMCRANAVVRDGWQVDFVRMHLAKRRREAAKKKLDAVLNELVQKRFNYVRHNDVSLERQKDSIIMDLILREYLQEAPQDNQKDLDSEFLEDVMIQIRTLVVAGTGTTTDSICFAYMLLSDHPEVVQKLREEHDRVFAPGIDASYDILCSEPYKLNQLEYTTNVLKETLRLYPVGCTARREHDVDGFLPYKGRQYPTTGNLLILPTQHIMHMDPKIFPNPKAFDPDRFAREDFVRYAWRPFERGPRACLGQPLAMDEMKIMLLLTIRDFDFTCVGLKPNNTPRVPWTDLDLTFGDRAFQEYVFEAKPRDGMPMSVRKSNWA